MKKITWNLRIKTVSEANCTQHWTKKSKRHKLQQFFIVKHYYFTVYLYKLKRVIILISFTGSFLYFKTSIYHTVTKPV